MDDKTIRVAELFAGVGGFRLALDGYHDPERPEFDMPAAGNFKTIWANQWEPPGSATKQFAWRCYEERFGEGLCVNEDIHEVLDAYESGEVDIPDVDMVVGGFPCIVAGTPVLTDRGYKPIESVEVGDMVLTHRDRYRRVVRTGAKHDAPLVRVTCSGCEPLVCTPNHPFMTRTRFPSDDESGLVLGGLHEHAAGDLVCGEDYVLLAGGVGVSCDAVAVDGRDYAPVTAVERLGERADVYNFEVEEDHTYVVGKTVVHNCQDYSVAKPLSMAGGIEGKKGVLWWDIYRFLRLKPGTRLCLFENVDRLLKSPVKQRGRDFAIILSCLSNLGYAVEWRVVNSAEYGFPQRRKRVFIFAEKGATWDLRSRVATDGVMADALPIEKPSGLVEFDIPADPYDITQSWPDYKTSPFLEAGCCCDSHVVTCHIAEAYKGRRRSLGDVVVDASEVPADFWVPDEQLPRWEYLKGSKREERTTRDGFTYWYSEGSMAYPDLLTNPSRTILTGEGGRGASRFKHIIEQDGRMRRLVPDELDLLQGFPAGWTDTGMTDGQRAFCMGNALVVGVVHRIGKSIADREK